MFSERSTYRPSQKRFSATRLGSSVVAGSSRIGSAGARSDTALTGPSAMIQVSLLLPPRCIETMGTSSALETRVSPPGITANESPVAPT